MYVCHTIAQVTSQIGNVRKCFVAQIAKVWSLVDMTLVVFKKIVNIIRCLITK